MAVFYVVRAKLEERKALNLLAQSLSIQRVGHLRRGFASKPSTSGDVIFI